MPKQLLLNLSDSDMEILNTLSSKQGLKKSEYLRMLLQSLWIAETLKEDKRGNFKFEIGGYGYVLEKEFIEEYISQLQGLFEGIEKRIKRVDIKPKGYRPPKAKKVA